jgi:phage baseplate assembly protein gpV
VPAWRNCVRTIVLASSDGSKATSVTKAAAGDKHAVRLGEPACHCPERSIVDARGPGVIDRHPHCVCQPRDDGRGNNVRTVHNGDGGILMATLQGVYTASVLDNRDPEGLARVLVRVSGLDDPTATRGTWARMATMMAGRDRGTWFIPEMGDEVLVAFERGDMRAPYVIGALWNAKSRPPAASGDASTTKMIKSRSGVTLRFRDDSASGVVMETPGGQRVTLQDGPGSVRIEDGNGNSITLGTSGVTINASAAVTVNAGSKLEINASAVTVNAGTSKFSGVVQCDTLIANSVVGSSYTPGAGNIL